MFDGQERPSDDQPSDDQPSGHQRSQRVQQSLPRELQVAAAMLVVIMVVMGLALWAVAGRGNQQHGQANADVSVELPTSELLQSLVADLGPTQTLTISKLP
jgi:hypothetical protein